MRGDSRGRRGNRKSPESTFASRSSFPVVILSLFGLCLDDCAYLSFAWIAARAPGRKRGLRQIVSRWGSSLPNFAPPPTTQPFKDVHRASQRPRRCPQYVPSPQALRERALLTSSLQTSATTHLVPRSRRGSTSTTSACASKTPKGLSSSTRRCSGCGDCSRTLLGAFTRERVWREGAEEVCADVSQFTISITERRIRRLFGPTFRTRRGWSSVRCSRVPEERDES